jgi:transcriptional regulator with XRE-family HTH domain
MKRSKDKINILIGRRVREARIVQGMTLMQLGAALGVSFQAIQKYESGDINIVPPKLILLTEILKVPIGYFFAAEDAPPEVAKGSKRQLMEVMRKLLRIEQDQPEVFEAICEEIRLRAKLSPFGKSIRNHQPSKSRMRRV